MSWLKLLRIVLLLALSLAFLISLLGILFTGPVVVEREAQGIDAPISPARLRETVETLCGGFTPRDYRHPDNLDAAAGWIRDRLEQAGLAVELQHYELREGRFTNVIGFRPGTHRDLGALILGAHYDAYGSMPGANDNASGVAVLLELARTLPEDPPRHDEYFVAFSTEEPPFFGTPDMGSHFFARSLIDRGVTVELMVAIDLIGYYTDEPASQHFPIKGLGFFYPTVGNFAAVVGDLRSGASLKRVKHGMRSTRAIDVHSFRGPRAAGVMLSDHLSFRELGLPGVLLTDTAFLRYPHYHQPEDTPDRLDYESMGQVVRALHGVF